MKRLLPQLMLLVVTTVAVWSCGANPCGSSPSGPSCPTAVTAVLTVKSVSGLTATFDASASAGSGLTYSLSYDDGASDQQQSPIFSHTFVVAGGHSATLTVRDDHGHSATQAQSFSLSMPPPTSIRISGIYGGPVALANCDTVFDIVGGGASTDDAQFYPLWSWWMDYGDGSTTTTVPVHAAGDAAYTHVYAAPGAYTATVRVGDLSGGHTTTGTYTVNVSTITGTWSNTFFNPTANRTETRVLTLTQAANGVLTGTYTNPESNPFPLTGTIAGARLVELTNPNIQFTSRHSDPFGDAVYGVNGSDTTITLFVLGGSADQRTLVFTRR